MTKGPRKTGDSKQYRRKRQIESEGGNKVRDETEEEEEKTRHAFDQHEILDIQGVRGKSPRGLSGKQNERKSNPGPADQRKSSSDAPPAKPPSTTMNVAGAQPQAEERKASPPLEASKSKTPETAEKGAESRTPPPPAAVEKHEENTPVPPPAATGSSQISLKKEEGAPVSGGEKEAEEGAAKAGETEKSAGAQS